VSLRKLKSTWEDLGRSDPLWAVLSRPEMRDGQWDLAEFMATGLDQVTQAGELLDRHGLSFGHRVLDFGCGVGRLTNALATRVDEAVGVDIAESMIEQATALNQHPDRVSFRSYDGERLPFEDASFDSALSLIVLQHARPPVQLACLLELQRVVRVGGVICLQIPSHTKVVPALDPKCRRALIEIVDAPSVLAAAEAVSIRARVTNQSSLTWPIGHRVKLGNHWLQGEQVLVNDDGRTDLPSEVRPGEVVDLDLLVTAPRVHGRVQLELDMLQEAVSWWKDDGGQPVRVEIEVVQEVADSASSAGETATMEMHGMPTTLVEAVFAHCGSEVVAAIPDNLAGPEWESFTYLVRRLA
jgi:SAM-dependent methyltransferase